MQPGSASHSLHSQDALGDALGDKSPFLSFMPQKFTKYLRPSDRADIILLAINNMRDPSTYSIRVAAHMVDVLVLGPAFQPGQVSRPGVAQLMLQPPGAPFLPRLCTWPALTPSPAGMPQREQKQLPEGAGETAALTLLTSPLPPVSPLQVLKIVRAIYTNLPSIRMLVAVNSLDRALRVLADKHPSEVVAGLLHCSPTCT